MSSRYVYIDEILYGWVQKNLAGAWYRISDIGGEIYLELRNITTGSWHPIFSQGDPAGLVIGSASETLPAGFTMEDDFATSYDITALFVDADTATLSFATGSTYASKGNSFLLTNGTETRRITLKNIDSAPVFDISSVLTDDDIGTEQVLEGIEITDSSGYARLISLVEGEASLQVEKLFNEN